MKKECEAEYHVEGCNGMADNTHHLTPKCIAKKLGWTRKEIDRKENMIPINKHCHRAIDRNVCSRKNNIVFGSLDDLREWRDRHDLVFK